MMMLWFTLALVTLVVAAALLLPLLRKRADLPLSEADYDRAVYRDQLAELERDAARGIIGPAEAEAAKNEIARRLLQTEKAAEPVVTGAAKLSKVARFSVLLVPLVAIPIYYRGGSPSLPDVPLKTRMAEALQNKDLPAMLAIIEQRLEKTPDDLTAWQILAAEYPKERRYADAARAYENVLRLSTPTADLYVEYAQNLMLANNGDIDKDIHSVFSKALVLDPQHPKAAFFDALAFKQEGNIAEAKKRLAALLEAAPADASYRSLVGQELAALNAGSAPALTQEQVKSGAAMSTTDQAAMVNSMIDGLEQRLGSTSTDIEGWKRLIRARTVNKQADRAKAALATARTIFKDNTAALDDLKALATELGLSS